MTYAGPVDWPVLGLEDIHDGDTWTLLLDRGFGDRSIRTGRLRGYDTPESKDVRAGGAMRRISNFERARALDATIFAKLWFEKKLDEHRLSVVSSKDPETLDRWLMGPHDTYDLNDTLGRALHLAELAVPYSGRPHQQRWWQVYDRPDWTPGSTTVPPTGGAGS